MSNPLSSLRDLHEIDVRIHKLKRLKADVPRRLKEHEAVLNAVKSKLDAKNQELIDHQKKADGLELELNDGEASIEKMQVQLNGVKTNNEYQVLTTQIESAKADNSRLEEQILVMMDGVEDIRSQRTAREGEVKEAEGVYKQAETRLNEEAAKLQSEIDAIESTRGEALAAVPEDALDTYSRILERTKGSAMAAVKDRICQECQMQITMHDLTRILNQEIVTCRSCTHILYSLDK